MLRSKPKLSYCGLTIAISNPSRFDKVSLLSSTGGHFFNQLCLRPDFNIMQCDVRLAEDSSPLVEGTKCILAMGDFAMHSLCPQTTNNTIHEMRGSVLMHKDIPTVFSYLPQDCVDLRNHEKEFNEEAQGWDDPESNDEDDERDIKGMSPTKRSNYAFWLKADTDKAKRILSFGYKPETQPTFKIFPSCSEVIGALENNKNKYFYFDIETDYECQNLLCFSFGFEECSVIYSVPILTNEYKWAYSEVPKIMQALAICVRDNITVSHNGHAFDFLVLAMKYGISIGRRTYDTMIAMHRCFPNVEKSLGHCISYWTWLNFHKDTDSKGYFTHIDMINKLQYCAKDVWGMRLVHKAIEQFTKTVPGLAESIQCGCDSIKAYLTATFQGVKYDPSKIDTICSENDRLMMQYNRVCELLIGKSGMLQVKSAVKSKHSGLFPGSRLQVCEYLHNILGYQVILRSKDTGLPSVGKKTLYKLQLKHPNPVIQFINMYRERQKETGALRFNPWRDNNNMILPRIKPKE